MHSQVASRAENKDAGQATFGSCGCLPMFYFGRSEGPGRGLRAGNSISPNPDSMVQENEVRIEVK